MNARTCSPRSPRSARPSVITSACQPSQPVSVLTSQGTVDPIVPFNGGSMVGRGGPSTILAAYAVVDRWRQLNGLRA